MTTHHHGEPDTAPRRPAGQPIDLPLIAPAETLQQEVRAQILDHPDTWHDMAGDGRWLADQLWPHWAATLEPLGVTEGHLAHVVAGYRRELWLWVVGERTWEHTLTALAGRLLRRAPPPVATPTSPRKGHHDRHTGH